MSTGSSIEWTDATWNPVTGCTKVSEGCRNCYAERMALRLQAMGQERYRDGFKVTLHEDALTEPLRWRKPRMVFVCSMSDLFHEDVPDAFVLRVMLTMVTADQHTYQILTKRPERAAGFIASLKSAEWPKNAWLGTSVENQATANERIPHLRRCPAAVRFLSCEPLLGPIRLRTGIYSMPGGGEFGTSLDGIHWVIVGGESGPKARPMDPDWARSIRDQCQTAGVPFFFKQWGGVNKKKAGRVLDGRTWDEMPRVEA